MFAIEYYNPHRKAQHKGRFFKKPDVKDLARVAGAEERWRGMRPQFVPDQEILPGDETDRLHRWGYSHYRQMFNDRQLLGLELSCRLIHKVKDERVRHALATNLSDLLRYQNMLCRYDTWALKSLDIFSVHGFPVGLVECESNLLGIINGNDANVGSGGWTNIIDKYAKAKRYCDAPFEVQRQGSRNVQVPVPGEWIGERRNGGRGREVKIHCGDATAADFAPGSLDAVFTDPPYFGNVQYGELMDFCYIWLRRLVGSESEGFDRVSSRAAEELTGNVTRARGLEHFTEGLGHVYARMAQALKPGAPLAFTYHHNKLEAYFAVGVAILDSGSDVLRVAAVPCRDGRFYPYPRHSVFHHRYGLCLPRSGPCASAVAVYVRRKACSHRRVVILPSLRQQATSRQAGDTRCIIFGHLTRMAVWNLRKSWDRNLPTVEKLELFAQSIGTAGRPRAAC